MGPSKSDAVGLPLPPTSAPLPPAPSIYLIADVGRLGERDPVRVVRDACVAGVDIVQLRAKAWSDDEVETLARRLVDALRPLGVPVLVNDRVEIAARVGAAGAHVGQDDMDAGRVRDRLGAAGLIGVSAASIEEVRRAADAGADYVGVGAIFPTDTKDDAGYVGLEELARIIATSPIPVYAIGGIDGGNCRRVVAAGCRRIAVAGAVLAAPDPAAAAAQLKEALASPGDPA